MFVTLVVAVVVTKQIDRPPSTYVIKALFSILLSIRNDDNKPITFVKLIRKKSPKTDLEVFVAKSDRQTRPYPFTKISHAGVTSFINE